MSIKQARQALRGTLEPEVVEVEVPMWLEDVYLYELGTTYTHVLSTGRWLWTHHTSCAAAFAAVPEVDRPYAKVTQISCIKIGTRYFRKSGEINNIGIGPDPKNEAVIKPKRAKGAK